MSKKDLYWLCTKISFAFFWSWNLMIMTIECKQPVAPIGIAKWLDYSFLFHNEMKLALLLTVGILSFFYISEKYMRATTSLMFILSLLIITFHESQGVYYRNTSYTVIPGVQALSYWIGYFRKVFNIVKYRLQFTVQIITSFYLLAAISKLKAAGVEWIFSGKYFALQILKNQFYVFYDSGDLSAIAKANEHVSFFIQHDVFLVILLTFSFLLEFFAFTALFGKIWRTSIGFLLLSMHIGIYLIMGILIGGIAFNMVIYFLNPLYFLLMAIFYLKSRITISKDPVVFREDNNR